VAGAAVLGRLTWAAVSVAAVHDETPRTRTLELVAPDWPGHRAGQHLDVRLTAEDGYQASRSYSIASAPGEQPAITIERLPDGEVSPYLVDVAEVGDGFEVRGPVGGYFVWEEEDGGPLLLVAGGSGIVPLMAMLRHRAAIGSRVPTRLLYSSRTLDDIIYREELDTMNASDDSLEVVHSLTRDQPTGWEGRSGRVDDALLADVAWTPRERPLVFVCGPTGFVEAVTGGLVRLEHEPARIKTERFGATG
jgi:ferredoxin-NADP reductase